MKYIEKKYQDLIKDMERAHSNLYDTLSYHINELKKTIAEKDEELEKLKGGNKLAEEIATLSAGQPQVILNDQPECDGCKHLEDELASAQAEARSWETRFYTLVHQYGINLNRPVEKKNVEKAKEQVKNDGRGKYERKTFIVTCGDCGVLFEAKGGNAKYCPDCRKARISARSRAWKLKHRKNK